MSKIIKVTKEINNSIFDKREDGEIIYDLIKSSIYNDKNIILDFDGIESSFLLPFFICIGGFFDSPENSRIFLTHVQIKANLYLKNKINFIIEKAKRHYITLDQE